MNKLYKFENGKRVKVLEDIECPVCKKVFSPRTSKDIYCSRTCYYAMKKIRGDRVVWTNEMRERVSKKMSGKKNPNYGNPKGWGGYKRPEMTGNKHPNWKGGCYISRNGYRIHCINGKDVPEHRIVMEEHLGRKLEPSEIVHHKDGNGLNNNIDNLELVSRSKHINIHREELKKGKIDKTANN